MHNINFIRDNPIIFDNFMKQRGELPCSKNIIKIDEDKRNTQTVLKNLLSFSLRSGFRKILVFRENTE